MDIAQTRLEEANVIPIFKKGRRTVLGNYRTVSITSVLGKILEQ